MTTLELKLNLSSRLAREAEAAGLLTPQALSRLLKDAVQKQSAKILLDGAARANTLGGKPMPMKKIQSEVNAVRADRRANALGKPDGKRA